jgi:uncharacterized membrane protein
MQVVIGVLIALGGGFLVMSVTFSYFSFAMIILYTILYCYDCVSVDGKNRTADLC